MDDSHDTKLHNKSYDLHDETYTILSAAADTTGNAMTTTLRHIVSNPTIYSLLHEELLEAFPDEEIALPFATLERLPYLVSPCVKILGFGLHTLQTGVIKEGLRYEVYYATQRLFLMPWSLADIPKGYRSECREGCLVSYLRVAHCSIPT